MEDLRKTRTKKMIESAMMELIELKGFTNVRLTDVAKHAMVNRNTIYLHYESKEAIVMSMINRAFSENFIALDAARAITGRISKARLKETFVRSCYPAGLMNHWIIIMYYSLFSEPFLFDQGFIDFGVCIDEGKSLKPFAEQ